MLLINDVLLVQYSDYKISFRKIIFIFDKKIDFENSYLVNFKSYAVKEYLSQ